LVDFGGRVVVVTGAGGGLGRQYALKIAALGANVVVNDVGRPDVPGSAAAVVDEIGRAGGRATAFVGSVSDEGAAQELIATALSTYGAIDALICNAGIVRDKSFAKMTPESFRAVLDVHIFGSYYPVAAAWSAMREAEYGRIVLTTSHAGLYGNFGQSNYSTAKMGLVGLVNTLAIEGAPRNIAVNAIAPVAATPMTSAGLPEELRARLDPAFAATAVAYLASDSCDFSGDVIIAAGGHYSRAQMFESSGVRFDAPVEIEEFAAALADIREMGGAHDGKLTNFSWRT
jgi:NAD(P)-dependent dehydrogenase (short-subunit alcohol dehydrogenase family)